MGRKPGGLYINPKKFGSLHKPCMKEMLTFLNCLALCNNNDEKCVRQKELLNACMDAQVIFNLLFFPIDFAAFFLIHMYIVDIFCRPVKIESLGEASIITCRGLTGGGGSSLSLIRPLWA